MININIIRQMLFCFLGLAIALSHSCKAPNYSAQVSYRSSASADGTILLEANGIAHQTKRTVYYGNNKAKTDGKTSYNTAGANKVDGLKERIKFDALRNALSVLLYQGVPNSEMRLPLISNESQVSKKNDEALEKLLLSGEASKFIVSNEITQNPTKISGGYYTAPCQIRVNYESLRRKLEQNGIIRKFGY